MMSAIVRLAVRAVQLGIRLFGVVVCGHRLRSRALQAFRSELKSFEIDRSAINELASRYKKLPKSWR